MNWNTRDMLHQCLGSVYATVHGLEFEVWVVDNASTDGSAGMVREAFLGVHLIENTQNLGFARANNQALEMCMGRYALLLNSDAFLGEGAAAALVKALEDDPRAGIVGACFVYPDGREQVSYGRLPGLRVEVGSLVGLDKIYKGVGERGKGEVKAVGAVSGACLLARRAMLEQVGLLDERFFMFSEEIDLCKRAWTAGWKVVHIPAARVVHVGGGSSGLTAERVLQLYRGKLQYFEKHAGKLQVFLLWLAMWLSLRIKSLWYTLLGHEERRKLWQALAHSLRGPSSWNG